MARRYKTREPLTGADAIKAEIAKERLMLDRVRRATGPEVVIPEYLEKLVKAQENPKVTALLRRQTRALLADNLPKYAQLHLQGAQHAAEKGDTRPMEWALQSIKPGGEAPAVEAAAKIDGGGGVRILIGVQIGGIVGGGGGSPSNEEKANAAVQAEAGRVSDPRVVEGTLVGGPDPQSV